MEFLRISRNHNNLTKYFTISAGQKLIINMWQEHAASPLHVLHGGFGIGSFIIPLIANPFLAVPGESAHNATQFNNTNNVSFTTTPSQISTTTAEPEFYIKPSRIEYAYFIAAAITISLSLVFYAYHFMGANTRNNIRIQSKKEKETLGTNSADNKTLTFREMFNPATCAGGRVFYGLQIFGLLCLYFFNCVGGERVAGKFIRAFSIDQFGFSTDEGSYLNTCFWISFAVGRVLGFLTARWIPIRILILLETGCLMVTTIFLVIFGASSSTALWVLMQPAGFFVAPLFPTGLGWGNFHVQMTGVAITTILLGGSLGGVVYMKLIGYLYDHYGPRSFLYVLLGHGILVFVLAIILDLVGAQHGGRYKEADEQAQQEVSEGEKRYAIQPDTKF